MFITDELIISLTNSTDIAEQYGHSEEGLRAFLDKLVEARRNREPQLRPFLKQLEPSGVTLFQSKRPLGYSVVCVDHVSDFIHATEEEAQKQLEMIEDRGFCPNFHKVMRVYGKSSLRYVEDSRIN